MTTRDDSVAPARVRRWVPERVLVIAIGTVLMSGGMLTWALGSAYLPGVDPSEDGYGIVYSAPYTAAQWGTHAGVIALAMVLCAGLPVRSATSTYPAGAVSQGIAAVAGMAATALGFIVANAFYFASPGEGCYESSCWPMTEQSLVAALPSVLAALAMLAMALLAGKLRWWVRVAVPAVVWLGLVVVLRTVWDPVILPWLESGLAP